MSRRSRRDAFKDEDWELQFVHKSGSVPSASYQKVMAGVTQAEEVAALKASMPGQVKVISAVGAFANVVTVRPHDVNIQCKFQLHDDYPVTAPTIVVHSTALSHDQTAALSDHLENIALSRDGQPPMLQNLIKECLKWLKNEGIDTSIKAEKPKKKEKQPKQQKKSNSSNDTDEAASGGKKPPMKTAADVINRIQWDPIVDKDNFAVGYMDRITGLEEKLFTAFTWEDLASVDQFCLAIPQHRIQYFKYKKEKVWEKTTRLDNVFGSTGSKVTILEAMKKYDEEHGECGVRAEGVECEPEWDAAEGKEEVEAAQLMDGNEQQCENSNEMDARPKEDGYQRRVRQNHFLALEITNPATIRNLVHMQKQVCLSHPHFKPYIFPQNGFHITLTCLALDDPVQIANCVQALTGIQTDLMNIAQQCPPVIFDGLDNFSGGVIFAKVKYTPEFIRIVNTMKSTLVNAGLNVEMKPRYTPHLTLFKVWKEGRRKQNWQKYVSSLSVVKHEFGDQAVNNIQLCRMGSLPDVEAGETGFYPSVFRLDVPATSADQLYPAVQMNNEDEKGSWEGKEGAEISERSEAWGKKGAELLDWDTTEGWKETWD